MHKQETRRILMMDTQTGRPESARSAQDTTLSSVASRYAARTARFVRVMLIFISGPASIFRYR